MNKIKNIVVGIILATLLLFSIPMVNAQTAGATTGLSQQELVSVLTGMIAKLQAAIQQLIQDLIVNGVDVTQFGLSASSTPQIVITVPQPKGEILATSTQPTINPSNSTSSPSNVAAQPNQVQGVPQITPPANHNKSSITGKALSDEDWWWRENDNRFSIENINQNPITLSSQDVCLGRGYNPGSDRFSEACKYNKSDTYLTIELKDRFRECNVSETIMQKDLYPVLQKTNFIITVKPFAYGDGTGLEIDTSPSLIQEFVNGAKTGISIGNTDTFVKCMQEKNNSSNLILK